MPVVIRAAESPSRIFRHRSTAWSFVVPAGATFEELLALSKLLFVRGDLLGRIADHDRAELIATEAIALSPDTARDALHPCAARGAFPSVRGGKRASRSRARGRSSRAHEVDAERAALLQATGRYSEALALREGLAKDDPGIHTLGALASLLAEMGEWAAAEDRYAAALDADEGVSPIPCAQLLFEWGVSAMRRGDLDRAEEIFAELDAILPAARSGARASRRGGARPRTVGRRSRARQAAARNFGRSGISRDLRGDPGGAR